MDVWVNFANATKWQAKGIFKCFFPYKASSDTAEPEASATTTEKNLPLPRRKSPAHNIPLLSEDELNDLAERFSAAIPEDELSVASLQGYLLKNKTRPRECVNEVAEWVIKERETRAKLKKEKEEKEAQEKKEAEEKTRKEKEAKEKEEKEAKEKETKEKEEKEKEKKTEGTSLDKKVESEKDAATTATIETATDSNKTTSEAAGAIPATSSSSDPATAECDTESVSAEDDNTKTSTTQPGESTEKWVSVIPKPAMPSS